MRRLPAAWLSMMWVTLGCASAPAPVRVLSTQLPSARLPQPVNAPNDASAPSAVGAPRIGAPGGSGAGSRRVRVQSGNDTVGGLPAGIGGGTGPRG